MRVLVVDVGGTNVKILATGQKTPLKFPSGRSLTPRKMVAGIKTLAGRKKWQQYVEFGTARMIEAVAPDDVVLGGGNARKLQKLPARCRAGKNVNAFLGGFRMWENPPGRRPPARAGSRRAVARPSRGSAGGSR